jgi:uncharacterized protein GlcG (DUF336 family)
MTVSLETANKIIKLALEKSRELKLQPITVVVLDTGGHLVSAQREDDSAILRFEVAYGKAWACLGVGRSTRFLQEILAVQKPQFVAAMSDASHGRFVPVIGGVLIKGADGKVLGAVGATGDSGENDEKVVIFALEQCGFKVDLK